MASDSPDAVIRGVPAIASHLGPTWSKRKVLYAIEIGELPAFKLSGSWCARVSTLRDHFEQLEKQAAK